MARFLSTYPLCGFDSSCLQSKLASLKKQYISFHDLLTTPGFYRRYSDGTLHADEEVFCVCSMALIIMSEIWTIYLQMNPRAKRWKNRAFEYYDICNVVFKEKMAFHANVAANRVRCVHRLRADQPES